MPFQLRSSSSPRPQPQEQSIFLKRLVETRLKSESFEPFIDFLVLLG